MIETINFMNSSGLSLKGWFQKAEGDTVIICSHGFTTDKSEFGRFDKLAEELNKAGFSVFRFDFSGFGESDDTIVNIKKMADDLRCAIQLMKSTGFNKIGLLGYSLGGLIALKNYDPSVFAIVLWAPVTDIKRNSVHYPSKEHIKEIEEKGYFTMREKKRKWKNEFKIDKLFLQERSEIKQREICRSVKCPTLIIQGEDDDRIPMDDSKNALTFLPSDSMLKIISHADHFFFDVIDEVIKSSVEWFQKNS